MPADDARLIRLEDKVDQIGAALVQIARLDERIITLFKDHTAIMNRLEAVHQALEESHDRLDALEDALMLQKPFFTWLDRAGLAFIGLGSGWLFAKITGKVP